MWHFETSKDVPHALPQTACKPSRMAMSAPYFSEETGLNEVKPVARKRVRFIGFPCPKQNTRSWLTLYRKVFIHLAVLEAETSRMDSATDWPLMRALWPRNNMVDSITVEVCAKGSECLSKQEAELRGLGLASRLSLTGLRSPSRAGSMNPGHVASDLRTSHQTSPL